MIEIKNHDSKNVNFVNEKMNLKIFELSKKKSDNDENKMNIVNDNNNDKKKNYREIIEISNDE